MKNCKTFARSKQRPTLRKLFSLSPSPIPHLPPPYPTHTHQIKPYLLRLEQKFYYGDIKKYTDICFQSASKMQFLGVKKWYSANIFSGTKQKHVCWKICKVKIFGCFAGAYYFQCQVS